MEKKRNILFLAALLLLVSLGVITLTKTETMASESENRSLARFSHFTIETFLDGTFQDNFESALSDQFVLSEQIRLEYALINSELSTSNIKDMVCKGQYVELPNGINRRRATFDCGDYMVYFPEYLDEEKVATIEENLKKYSHVNKIADTYYYFINDSSVYDFGKNEKIVDYVGMLRGGLSGDYRIGELDFENYEGQKKYFYKTDHHLDYRGAQKAYEDIAELLGVNEVLKPTGTGTNHEYFFGSMAQNTKNYSVEEDFTFYEYAIPEHDTWVNGERKEYGNYDDYINHNYEYDRTTNYYAYFYGNDEGEVVFDFHQLNKDNLLIISNSYSNAINKLLAAHFNKTYVVDLRLYELQKQEAFVLSEYIKENKIDKVLFIMSPGFIYGEDLNRGLEL